MRVQIAAAVVGILVALASVSATAQVNPFAKSGFTLTKKDVELLKAASRKLYLGEKVVIGTSEKWSNPKSGSGGAVKLVDTHMYKGMKCRRLQHDITIAKRAEPFRYIIDRCQVPSGEWKML